MTTYTRTPADVAAAHERGIDEGIDLTIELVRQHLTPEQRHAVERDIAALLSQRGMDGARRLVEQRQAGEVEPPFLTDAEVREVEDYDQT